MDMQMPVMNGVEATIQIRKLNDIFKANIPIVAMTANAGAAEIKACMDAGMNDTLIKPFALSSLISLLNLHLYNQKNMIERPWQPPGPWQLLGQYRVNT